MADPGPRLLGARRLFRSSFLTLQREYLIYPGGRWSIREIVRHPGSVVVIPWDGTAVALISQYRHAAGRRILELPAGKLDVAGEPPVETARRECIEEVGLDPGQLSRVQGCFTSPGFTDEFSHIYLAEKLTPVEPDPQGIDEEQSEIVWMTPGQVLDALASQRVEDATTLVGLYALLDHLA